MTNKFLKSAAVLQAERAAQFTARRFGLQPSVGSLATTAPSPNATQLPDGSWVKNEDLESIHTKDPAAYNLITEQGLEAYQQNYEKTLKAAQEFLVPGTTDQYDVGAALKKIPEAKLALLFGTDAVTQAKTAQTKEVRTMAQAGGIKPLVVPEFTSSATNKDQNAAERGTQAYNWAYDEAIARGLSKEKAEEIAVAFRRVTYDVARGAPMASSTQADYLMAQKELEGWSKEEAQRYVAGTLGWGLGGMPGYAGITSATSRAYNTAVRQGKELKGSGGETYQALIREGWGAPQALMLAGVKTDYGKIPAGQIPKLSAEAQKALDEFGPLVYLAKPQEFVYKQSAELIKRRSPELYNILVDEGTGGVKSYLAKRKEKLAEFPEVELRGDFIGPAITPEGAESFWKALKSEDIPPEALLQAQGIPFYDMEKIATDPKLRKIFEEVIPGGAEILAPYETLGKLEDYKMEGGGYNLQEALENKAITRNEAAVIFGEEATYEAELRAQGFREPTPSFVSSSIPPEFLSDEEYQKLDLYKPTGDYYWDEDLKMHVRPTKFGDLAKQGDLRAKWGVDTWAEAVERERTRLAFTQLAFPGLEMRVFYPADPVYQDIKARLDADPNNPRLQEEMKAYKALWARGGITFATLAGSIAAPFIWGGIGTVGGKIVSKIIPASIESIPVLGGVPRATVALTQYVGTATPIAYTGANISEAVQSTNLQRKWEVFQKLPEGQKDFWARKAGYDSFGGLTEAQQGNVLLHYAVPPGYSLEQWSAALQEQTDRLLVAAGKGAGWLMERSPKVGSVPIAAPLIFAEGTVVGVLEGAGYMAQIPLIAANITDKVPEGSAKEYAEMVGAGMLAFFTTMLPVAFKANPTLASGRVVGLFILGPEALTKLAKSGFAGLSPRYVPERAMGMEYSTIKIELDPKQSTKLSAMSPKERMAAGTEIVDRLRAGESVVVKDLGAVSIKVKNVPYQQVMGNRLWHFTPDITDFSSKVKVDTLYTSPQAAVKAGVSSLVKGERATHPGLIEVIVPEGSTFPIEKLLRGGKAVEMEAPVKNVVLDPIPGWQGKGVSANAYFGSYPIRRFTLAGETYPYTQLTPVKLAEIRAMAFGESVADAFLGWHGRMKAYQLRLRGNKALRQSLDNANTSLQSLKNSPDSVTGRAGEVISQLQAKHPSHGLIKERVRGLIIHKDKVLFVRDKSDPVGVYDAVGGGIKPDAVLVPERGKWNYQMPADKRPKVTWELGFRSQALGELDMAIKGKNAKYLGMYRAKTGEHSIYGARIFEATVDSPYFNRVKAWEKYQRSTSGLQKPEIAEAFWWDGKTTPRGEVQPWFYDMLAAVADKHGWDMSKLQIRPTQSDFFRDAEFAARVKAGQNPDLTSAQRRLFEEQWLKNTQKDVTPSIGFIDWLKSEGDYAYLHEMLAGRQRAWKVIKNTSLENAKIPELLKMKDTLISQTNKLRKMLAQLSDVEIKEKYGMAKEEIGKKLDTARLEEANTIKNLKAEAKRLSENMADIANKRLAQEDIRTYLEGSEFLRGRYTNYFDKALRRLGAGVRVEDLRTELTKYRPTEEELEERYEPYRETTETRTPERPPGRTKSQPRGERLIRSETRKQQEKRGEIRGITTKRVEHIPARGLTIPRGEIITTTTEEKIVGRQLKKGGGDNTSKEAKRQEFAGSTGWQQGFVIYALKPPYASREDVAIFHKKNPPPGFTLVKGGPEAAFRSIQSMTGKAPEKLKIDLGIQDILISSPKRKPGAPGAIEYKQDIGQKTTGDITITSTGRGQPKVTKGVAEETVPVNPLESSKMPKEVAEAIGSYDAKVTPEGKVKLKVKRL